VRVQSVRVVEGQSRLHARIVVWPLASAGYLRP
jgi:hypothetical protein